jgi:hypothetical protein
MTRNILLPRLHQVKALQDEERMREYLSLLRTMDGYGSVVFPHCASDAKREGHVVPIVTFQAFRLQASGFIEFRSLPTPLPHPYSFNTMEVKGKRLLQDQ